jgi:hypothetical protein
VTVQWSIMAEGAIWGHESGPKHSMGTLIGRYGQGPGAEQRISIHHSLYAHNLGRNPRIGVNAPTKTNEQLIDFRNNIVYNWGGAQGPMELNHVLSNEVTPVPLSFGTILQINIVNNTFILGPTGGSGAWPGTIGNLQGPSKIYLVGNATTRCPTTCDDRHWKFAFISGNDLQYNTFASTSDYAASSAFSVAPVTTTPTAFVENVVLTDVGATKPKRDPVDERIINDVRSRTGALGPFHGVKQVTRDRYPVLATATPPQDTDHDGIPDSWEIAHGLNPKKASDGAALAANGYTNVENYLNELAGDPIPGFGQPLPTSTNLRAVKSR